MGRSLIVYFSATGTTAKVAQRIAKRCEGVLYEIQPELPYTDSDLDWHDKLSRSTVEMQDPESRPAIVSALPDIAKYDWIYLGFPIWWGVAPRIVNSFLDQVDLTGKAVHVFVTSGSSGVDEAVADLKRLYPKLDIVEAERFGAII